MIKKDIFFWYIISSIITLILFRNSVTTIAGSWLANVIIILTSIFFPYFILSFIKDKYKIIHAYVFILFILTIASILKNDSFLQPIIGFFNLASALSFFVSAFYIFKDKNKFINKIIRLFVIISLINSVGAFIQVFISIDIFGLINNSVYTNIELMKTGNIQVRAISFISSPQSLSLTLSISCILCLRFNPFENKNKNSLSFIICLLGGILTISKAFYLPLCIFFFLEMILKKNIKVIIVSIPILLILFMSTFTERIVEGFSTIFNISEYSAYEHWINGLKEMDNISNFLFGKGVGYYSRGFQLLSGNDESVLSVESFIIQLFSEAGLIITLLFIIIIYISLKLSFKKDYRWGLLQLSILSVGLFTPAIYGFVVGFQYYFILLVPFYLNNQQGITR